MSNGYGLEMNQKWTLPSDSPHFIKFMREQNYAFAQRMKLVYFPHMMEPVKVEKGPKEPEAIRDVADHPKPLKRDFMDVSKTVRTRPEPKAIIRSFEEVNGLEKGTLVGESRAKHVIEARYNAMAEVSKVYPELSQSSVGRIFKRDRTTVIHALKKLGLWKPAQFNPFVKEDEMA